MRTFSITLPNDLADSSQKIAESMHCAIIFARNKNDYSELECDDEY